jgi:hypothetical protein
MITMVSGFMTLSARAGLVPVIPDNSCGFAILKLTPQVESLDFPFLQVLNDVETEIFIASNNFVPSDFIFISPGEVLTYTELFREGWTLEEIECIVGAGVEVTKTEDSVTFECVNPSGEFSIAFCAFFNRVSADKIPTLSEWGMISAAAGLGLIGVFFAIRRRKIQDA